MAGKAKGRGRESGGRARSARKARRDRSPDDMGYREKARAGKQAAGGKAGCAPKLFMLLLPFVAAGTFLILKS